VPARNQPGVAGIDRFGAVAANLVEVEEAHALARATTRGLDTGVGRGRGWPGTRQRFAREACQRTSCDR
jgi:hypothetical protein